jgi:hypothetical protein
MKKLLFLILILSACSEDEVKDPFTGEWQFNTAGLNASFDIKASGSSYIVEQIQVDSETWTDFEVLSIEKGEHIGALILRRDNPGGNIADAKAIGFYSLDTSEGNSINIDSVYYVSGTTTTKFYNQSLTKQQ